MKVIPLKKTVSNWNENNYGILYSGKRSFGYNADGIVYVNQEGNRKKATSASFEIIGCTVSIFVPGKENVYTPARYIFSKDLNNIKADSLKVKKNEKSYEPFHLPGMPYKEDGKLNMLIGQGPDGDYNGGSKALYESKDEGKTWEYIKEVPRER